MNDRIELLILKSLIYNEDFSRKVIPHLRADYFTDDTERLVFSKIADFLLQYNNRPSKEAVSIALSNDTKIGQGILEKAQDLIANKIVEPEPTNLDWLLDATESWVKSQALYNALKTGVEYFDSKKNLGAIPDIVSQALGVSFDPNVGHDYIRDAADRFDEWHKVEEKMPFDLDMMNRITKGGLPKKTLNIILAGTGVGKSLTMCHMASAALMHGRNVLYITLEMSKEMIAQRIDANLLDVSLDDLVTLPKIDYMDRINRLVTKNSALTRHSLKIKEYPTASASVLNFKALLNDLKLKESFVPDIIFVDYINLAVSSRLMGAQQNTNSYYYIKAIAEEFRGMAVEYNAAVVSATQTTRSGYKNTDPGLEDTSESFGLPATADFMIALVTNDELAERNQIVVKQLKNRYYDVVKNRKFLLGIDKSKMRLYDLDPSAQNDLNGDDADSPPIFDNSSFGRGMKAEKKKKTEFDDWDL